MKKWTILVLVAGALSRAWSPTQAQVTDTLDLTTIPAAPQIPPPAFREHALAVSGTPREAMPLAVTLDIMDRDEYNIGDSFHYRVTLRNSGKTPLVLPWEPDWRQVANDASQRIFRTYIGLELLDDRSEQTYPIMGQFLYGSQSTPASVKRVMPGQAVRLIVPGTWRLVSPAIEQAVSEHLPHTMKVRAQFSFAQQPKPNLVYLASNSEYRLILLRQQTR